MHATWFNFKDIKEHVAIEDVLSRYGVKLRSVGSDRRRGKCPLPSHSSPDSCDSFSISLSRNVWSCQSASCVTARSGLIGGNVLDFVALMEQCSLRDAASHLRDWFGSASPSVGQSAESKLTDPSPNRPLGFSLHNIDQHHAYLRVRDIHPETAKLFGAGMYSGSGFLHGRIVIPIYDEYAQLVAYVGRAIDNQLPKYRFPAGFRKSGVVFNLHRAIQTNERSVIIVEGYFDAFKVHQAGYPSVAALMGSSLSDRQADLLTENFDHVFLMLDGDPAGRSGTEVFHEKLQARIRITVLQLPDGVQPDQLASEEISLIVRSHRNEMDNCSN